MRAVVLTEFGPPPVLVAADMPGPAPGAGQVLVTVAFANITFVETRIRSGHAPFPVGTPPFVPGNGVGGVITAVGPGVDPGVTGTRVVTSTGGTGGYAEAVVVPADAPIPVPGDLALDDAVALLADGRTALALFEAARVRAGERVLVEAAAGGVGTLLTQLAHRAGATVIAAAGDDAKLALAGELGADVTVNYRAPAWPGRVRTATGGVDVVFDGVGGAIGTAAYGLIDPGGRMLVYGMASGAFPAVQSTNDVTVTRGIPLAPVELRALTERALTSGLQPVIGQRFALADAAKAHAAIEARTTTGKTLLTTSQTANRHTERQASS